MVPLQIRDEKVLNHNKHIDMYEDGCIGDQIKVRHFKLSIHIDPNDKHFMTEVDLFVVGDRHTGLTSIWEGDK